MNRIQNKVIQVLTEQGASLVRFVDISGLPPEQNRGLPHAVFFGIALTPSYLREVREATDYVQTMIAQNRMEEDEFYLKELAAGDLADRIAYMLVSEGYRAYSLSDNNLIATHAWDAQNLRTLLPQKTVAVLAGAGWLGKNNLLVTPAYGPALCIGTVLTDAPLHAAGAQVMESKCGTCRQCADICPEKVLYGRAWKKGEPREERIDVHRCTTCMKCVVHCPYTRRYLRLHL
ncbi:MAG: 4Fe-4S dicluster domain-containing protein [Parabacteroides sp.]|nr:4Fe-4S dicluster domain-containing protein [Parabacteroides sp.]